MSKSYKLYIVCKDGIHQKTVHNLIEESNIVAKYSYVYATKSIANDVYLEARYNTLDGMYDTMEAK